MTTPEENAATVRELIQKVLNEQAVILQAVMNDTKAPCWRPDPPSTGPCQVK